MFGFVPADPSFHMKSGQVKSLRILTLFIRHCRYMSFKVSRIKFRWKLPHDLCLCTGSTYERYENRSHDHWSRDKASETPVTLFRDWIEYRRAHEFKAYWVWWEIIYADADLLRPHLYDERCNLHRNEPAWFVGEHRQNLFLPEPSAVSSSLRGEINRFPASSARISCWCCL